MALRYLGIASSYLDLPGRYHVAVQSVDESPRRKTGEPLNATKVNVTIIGGRQSGKLASVYLFLPTPGSNRGEQGKIDDFLQASGVVDPLHGGEVEISPLGLIGAHLIVDFDAVSGQSWLRAARYFHIDDPQIQGTVQLNRLETLRIPPQQRRTQEWFSRLALLREQQAVGANSAIAQQYSYAPLGGVPTYQQAVAEQQQLTHDPGQLQGTYPSAGPQPQYPPQQYPQPPYPPHLYQQPQPQYSAQASGMSPSVPPTLPQPIAGYEPTPDAGVQGANAAFQQPFQVQPQYPPPQAPPSRG